MYLNADPTRLAQIVGNLLNNACKFTDRGGRIWLTVERSRNPEPMTPKMRQADSLRPSSSACAIPASASPPISFTRIFDMFTQVDTALERSVTGLGIGLTLVKTLTQMHGGTVDVSSAGIGQGSEFIVRLPIIVETAARGATRDRLASRQWRRPRSVF